MRVKRINNRSGRQGAAALLSFGRQGAAALLSFGRQGAAALAVLTVLLSGCAKPRPPLEIGGNLDLFGPTVLFSLGSLPEGWIIDGPDDVAEKNISSSVVKGVAAISVINGKKKFVAVRRTDSWLLVTPYLSWSWNVESTAQGIHPVRLVVGFNDGTGAKKSRETWSYPWLDDGLPPHRRAVSLVWGESALQRGTQTNPGGAERTALRYTVRGGRENAGRWFDETIDLSAIYAAAWPGDDISKVRVVFIGFAAPGGRAPARARFANLTLSR